MDNKSYNQESDYYPFGMSMPGREFSSGEYRYGFNNMEKDDELKGSGNSYDFGARIYDPRVGRWLAVDPLAGKYPGMSPYNFVGNSPLVFVDPDGRKIKPTNDAAEVSINELFNSYEKYCKSKSKYIQKDNVRTLFNIDVTVEDDITIYSSRDKKPLSYKEFKKKAVSLNFPNSKHFLQNAYTTYLALQTDEIIEIEGWQREIPGQSGGGEEGKEASPVVKVKVPLYSRETVNDDFQEAINSYKKNKEEGANLLFNNTSENIFNPEKQGENWVFFKDQNGSTKGIIVVDILENNSQTLQDALNNVTK